MFAMRHLFALAALTLAATACRSSAPAPSYSGTVIVGSDYVQLLVTAPGDAACPPRVQTIGRCVRTPPKGATDCQKAPPCVAKLTVDAGTDSASAAGSFVKVPWLSTTAGPLKIAISGCGGDLAFEVDVPAGAAAIEPFESASASLASGNVDAMWTATKRADNVCALLRSEAATEVCCGDDRGSASFVAPEAVRDFRLSRGKRLKRVGELEVLQTRETNNLLGE